MGTSVLHDARSIHDGRDRVAHLDPRRRIRFASAGEQVIKSNGGRGHAALLGGGAGNGLVRITQQPRPAVPGVPIGRVALLPAGCDSRASSRSPLSSSVMWALRPTTVPSP